MITDEQRSELSKWAQSRTLPAGDVFRARLILALAEGISYSKIMQTLQTTAPTISRWKQRFEEQGMAGLDARHKGSQPRVATAAVQARIARKTQQKPSDGSTHWSCRKMAEALGLSKSTVQRVWAQARLKPHRLDRYMASDDPRFEEKAADIIGLYMNPPQHAAVFCVDEKDGHSSLGPARPGAAFVAGPGRAAWREYYRHGTLSLYAALDVKTGAVHGMTAARHTSREFITFLKGLVERAEHAREIHVVLDNLSAHKTKDVMSNSLPSIRESDFTSPRPTPRGSIRWNCGSPKSNVTSSLAAYSPQSPILATNFVSTSVPIQNPLSPSVGPTPIPAAESSLTKSPGHLTSNVLARVSFGVSFSLPPSAAPPNRVDLGAVSISRY